jgi:NAD(P)-dependent dehydrogenase (short-subunit alcohol dehydrogenase family)
MSDPQAAVNGRDGGQPLAGQVAIVTGGGRGLGREVALRLAAAGACVAVAARSVEQIADTVARIEGSGGCASDFPVDISDPGAARDLVTAVEADLGPVDLLVNNAAVIWPLGPVWEVDPQEWWRLLEINLYGTFLCSNAILSGMTNEVGDGS